MTTRASPSIVSLSERRRRRRWFARRRRGSAVAAVPALDSSPTSLVASSRVIARAHLSTFERFLVFRRARARLVERARVHAHESQQTLRGTRRIVANIGAARAQSRAFPASARAIIARKNLGRGRDVARARAGFRHRARVDVCGSTYDASAEVRAFISIAYNARRRDASTRRALFAT